MTINSNDLGSAIKKFTFVDVDGDVLATMKINPMDVRLSARMKEVGDFFQNELPEYENKQNLESLVEFNNAVEDKICYVLGYDAKQSLFGMLSATTILPDGDFFAEKIANLIKEAIEPVVTERVEKMKKVKKYTEKYTG